MLMRKSLRPAWLFFSYSSPEVLAWIPQIFLVYHWNLITGYWLFCKWICMNFFLAHGVAIHSVHSSLLLFLGNFLELYLEILFLFYYLVYSLKIPIRCLRRKRHMPIFHSYHLFSIPFEFFIHFSFWLLFSCSVFYSYLSSYVLLLISFLCLFFSSWDFSNLYITSFFWHHIFFDFFVLLFQRYDCFF